MDKPQDKKEKLEELINEIVEKSLAPYYERLNENADRIIDLISLYKKLKNNPEFQSHPSLDDILRTSIVFTHATLEDFLRTLASQLLPFAESETLNQIPLAGLSPSSRAEKFLLGNLVKFKGKSIEEVIQESINNSLQNSNFNNTTDIAQLLRSLNIDISKVNESFPEIDELMKRRHIIVHRADKAIDGNNFLNVSPEQVKGWLMAVIKLVLNILKITAVQQAIKDTRIKDAVISSKLENNEY